MLIYSLRSTDWRFCQITNPHQQLKHIPSFYIIFIIEKQAGSIFISILNNNKIRVRIENATVPLHSQKHAVFIYASQTNYTPLETW